MDTIDWNSKKKKIKTSTIKFCDKTHLINKFNDNI